MAGVHFRGPFDFCYRVNLESRIASRVLWQVSSGSYRNENDIFKAAAELPWTEWFQPNQRIMVETNARNCALNSLDFVTLRIKDAICDRFREKFGSRPDVDRRSPDIRISAFLTADAFTIYLDTSGDSLFKRGYRDARIEAPLKENLAAGILRMTGWSPTDSPSANPRPRVSWGRSRGRSSCSRVRSPPWRDRRRRLVSWLLVVRSAVA